MTIDEQLPSPDARCGHHTTMLVIACAVIGLAFLFDVQPAGRVAVSGFPGYPLPHACALRTVFGVECPLCGLTRSFVHLAHGDWSASLTSHPAGWLLATLIVLQLPYRGLALVWRDPAPLGRTTPRLVGYGVVGLLLATWFVRLA